MKPCQSDYCPNAAGPSGRCDECRDTRWVPRQPKRGEVVENKTGKREYVLTAEEWQAVKGRA